MTTLSISGGMSIVGYETLRLHSLNHDPIEFEGVLLELDPGYTISEGDTFMIDFFGVKLLTAKVVNREMRWLISTESEHMHDLSECFKVRNIEEALA